MRAVATIPTGVHLCSSVFICALLYLFLAACSGPCEDQPADSGQTSKLDAEAIAANNRGVGLMGRFEYAQAVTVYEQLTQAYPDWLDGRINLAIAILNRQEQGDERKALALVDDVLKEDSANLRAHYVAGLLRLYLGSSGEALNHFRGVAEGDPRDAYAAYYLAQALAQESQHEQALKWYERAVQLDPYLRSAYYGLFQTLRRLKQADEARRLIADYQRLENNPRARLAEFKYTRMGPKGEVLAVDLERPAPPPKPEGPVFAAAQSIRLAGATPIAWRPWETTSPASVTAVDMHGDGVLDLFVANALEDKDLHNLVLRAQADDGAFAPELDHPLARVKEVNGALWGDFDNDGLTDVYLCRRGANQLWRQAEKGAWKDVTQRSRTAGGHRHTVDGAMFDADHDGDLDLFLVNADGPNELLNNNLDGTFRALGAEQGIAGDGRASRTVVPVDLDRDRDVDIIVINERPPHDIYINDRLWDYHRVAGLERLRTTPALSALAGDRDADGYYELYTVTPEGALLRWRLGNEKGGLGEISGPAPEQLAKLDVARPGWAQLALGDVNGDGVQDLLVTTPDGWSALSAMDRAQALFEVNVPGEGRLAAAIPVGLDAEAGPAMLGLGKEGKLTLWPPGPGRYPFLTLAVTGKEDTAQSMRSNASGIGTQVAVRTDSRWTLAQTYRNQSGPGQSLQPLAIGLGGAKRADFITLDWPDGVFQSELDLAAGTVHVIAETQRQLASCPVLFAWDGRRYAFVSDLLGVGGIGFALGRGEYATPRPWENVLLPPGLLKPREGRYRVKIGEPMEEVAYVDSVRLMAYDVPPGWQMALDERMGIQAPEPTGEVRFFRQERVPVQALNERGERVTASLVHLDGRAAPLGELDRRFIGRLKEQHILTLSFAGPLDADPGEPMLLLDGWVEYPYSQTMFAAWQALADYEAPTLEAMGDDGQWHTVLEQFGYPAGMPRRMSVPLKALPPGASALRLRTNMEIYWDRIAVAFAESSPEARRRMLPLRAARVAKTGFAQRTTFAQRRPHYDYGRRSPFWDTKYMAGLYTRLGPVEELVAEVDDALAIIGAGEEVHLEFAALNDVPPAGWKRYFVLETNGWAKDMDLYTKDGETVGPLPATGKPGDRREILHARYNTRYQSGR